jgi:hypothetical protein
MQLLRSYNHADKREPWKEETEIIKCIKIMCNLPISWLFFMCNFLEYIGQLPHENKIQIVFSEQNSSLVGHLGFRKHIAFIKTLPKFIFEP